MKTLITIFVITALYGRACYALLCYECGEYTDGVGSITPCLNYSEKDLKPCSMRKASCVKYTMGAIIVRGCSAACEGEEQSWGTVYCCDEDSCNRTKSFYSISKLITVLIVVVISILIQSIVF